MSVAGWYPDPGGESGRFRYWDGSTWSAQTSSVPTGPPPVPVEPEPRRGRTKGWLVVAAVVVVIALVVFAATRGTRGQSAIESTDTSTPTGSAWNETPDPTPSTPTATPSTPAPSAPDPSAPDPSGGRPVACDAQSPHQLEMPSAVDGRLTLDRLSMAVPDGWSGPRRESRLPFSRDVVGYSIVHPEESLGWQSSVSLAVSTFPEGTDLTTAARQLTQCIITSSFYLSVDVKLGQYDVTPTTISGRPAVMVAAEFTFDHPQLKTKGSAARLVLVQVDEQKVQIYFGVTPKEKSDLVALIDATGKGLTVG